MAESSEAPAKFNQIPVKPRGHNTMSKITGKIKAVDMEITEAGNDFSIASIKLCVAKDTQRIK